MLDHARKWPELPDWETARLDVDGLTARSVGGLTQYLVSGDLDAFATQYALSPAVGLLSVAEGDRYALGMARDRMLVVGMPDGEIVTGWNDHGFAVTRMSAALHVFEIAESKAHALAARGCVFDERRPGPSAAIQFAGVNAMLYAHGRPDVLRLHCDRALAGYVWTWIDRQERAHRADAHPATMR